MSELTTNKSNSYLEQAAILLLCLGEEAAATVMQLRAPDCSAS